MKALSLRTSDLIYFLQFYCETGKYGHVIVTCVNFCHFWSMEQLYISNNLRNKLAKNLGLVPNESPESEDLRHYLLFLILLSYGKYMCLFLVHVENWEINVENLAYFLHSSANISRTNWAKELGLVPNESFLFQLFRSHVVFPIPFKHCHFLFFFCDILVIFAIFGPFFHLVQLITRERIELRSWDWSQMKGLRL